MAAALGNPQQNKHITRSLRQFEQSHKQDLVEAALAKIPAEHHAYFFKALQRPSRAQGAADERKNQREAANAWETSRVVTAKPPDERDRPQHERQQAMLQAKDTGDETWRSEVARRFEAWCLEKSWVMCLECHRLAKRP